MIPKLYQKDGTTLIGNLTNCIECLVEEERNGIFEVTFQYPNTESIATSLVYDNIVICDANDTLKNQKFRIYDTRRMMNNTIEVYARHISFDLAYDYINSIDITNQSCEYALNTIFRSSQFSTGYVGHSDIINAQNYKISNCNALEAIAGKQGSIIDTYGTGAEILRDNTDIHVLNRRGNDNGVSIEYAKNLTGFELQEDTDDLITRIIPFATYTPEGGEQTRVQGTAVDSSYINNYSHPFISEIDFSDKFEDNEVPTPAKLATMAQRYFEENKCDLPKQNWKIEFIPLSKCVGYESIEDAISLCDTVTIKDTRYNINTKAKVIKTVYDVLRERYDSMELGEPRTTLGDIVNTGSEKGEQGPPGPQGPKGEDGNIGDFPDSVPSKPVLTTTLLGFASIQLDWTYDNKPYYWYEVYASKTKDFTPNLFDIVHKGQTSSFLFQAKPGETWYFRVCGVNSYDHRSEFSDQIEVITTKVDNLSNYFTNAAIGNAVVGSLTADYMTVGILKGNWIDAKNLSVTDGNGKRTLDIDSSGNVNLDVTSLRIASKDVATIENISDNLTNSSVQYYLSTSQTSLAGGSWQDTAPTWTQGKYMWQRMKYTTYNGTITYGTAVCIAGAKGDTGEQGPQGVSGTDGKDGIDGTDGQGLVSSTPQWYLSTSNTTQAGGSWQDTMPTLEVNKYLWTRYKNVWENPTSTTYTTPVLEQVSESVKDVSNRVRTVEQKITKDGLVSIVGDYYATPTEVETTYATKSEVTQTAESITYKFENSCQPNLLPHSGVSSTNTAGWYTEGSSYFYTGHDRYLGIGNTSTNEAYCWSPRCHIGAGGWYSLHGWIQAESNVQGADVFVIGSTDLNNWKYDFVHHCCNVGSNSGWYHFYATFEVPSNIKALAIRIDNNGRVNGDSGNYVVVFFGKFMLVRGKDNYPLYTDSVEGLYAGVTSVDKNGVHVKHDDGSSTNLNAKALNFYNNSNNLYAQVSNGVYKFWNGSNYIGYLGHAGWTADTSKRNISFAGEYGNTLTLSAKKTSSDTNYQTWLVVSGHEQNISGVNYHQGVILIQPRVSGIMHFYGQGSMGDTYPGMIFASTDAHLAIMGDSYVDIGIQVGSSRYNGIRVDEAGGNPYTTINMFGNLNMNGWHITNTQSVNSLSATSAASYARRSLSEEESYSDPTVKTITDIFPSQTPTEGEIRWTDRETYFTSEVESGVYECYIEIPWWIAQNLENNYHVSITPTNGFYQYYVSERDSYYFIVRSNKDSMGFTFEIVGKLLDNNTTANNASIAGDQYLASDLKEPEAANIVTELDTADIITPDTTSSI